MDDAKVERLVCVCRDRRTDVREKAGPSWRKESAMATATQILRQDHETISKVLKVTDQTAERFGRGIPVPPEVLEELTWFFSQFVNLCHASEEEDYLFPLLQKKGNPRSDRSLVPFLHQHGRARALLREMTAAIEGVRFGFAWAGGRWARAAHVYAALLRSHIERENQSLLPMSEDELTPDEQAHLAARFEELEVTRIGANARERLDTAVANLLEQSVES
jgi:hemerythrin-like domain-containing protein